MADIVLIRERSTSMPFSPPLERNAPRLFDAFPSMVGRVPWRPLCEVPTAVEPCDAIEDILGRSGVWMKRDDKISPIYGGNKVRRFEFLFAKFAARGVRRIITAGGLASTQVMATARFGQALGMSVRAVLFDQPVTRFAREAMLTSLAAGAELLYGGGYVRTAMMLLTALCCERDNALLMPGASGPLANLGYIDAMFELDAQVRAGNMPRPDVIVVPTGSAGTLAALSLGAAWLGWSTELVGVRIAPHIVCNRFTVGRVLWATRAYLSRFDRRARMLEPRFTLHHDAYGGGYGAPTLAAVENIGLHEKLVGVRGEVTYSGKALAALRALCHDPRYKHSTILFWNTLSSVPLPSTAAMSAKVPAPFQRFFVGELPI